MANILLLDKFLICIRFMTHTSGIIVTCQCRSHRATFWMKNERRKSRNYRFQLAGMWWISLSMVKMICKMKFSSRLSQKKEVIFFKIQYTLQITHTIRSGCGQCSVTDIETSNYVWSSMKHVRWKQNGSLLWHKSKLRFSLWRSCCLVRERYIFYITVSDFNIALK